MAEVRIQRRFAAILAADVAGYGPKLALTVLAMSVAGWTPLYGEERGSNLDMQYENRQSKGALCADRLRAFIKEIDQVMEESRSVELLQGTLRSYFPLYGCDIAEAVSIAKSSKYFYSADRVGSDRLGGMVIVLRKRIPGGWGFLVSFGLNLSTGDSSLPAAMVDTQKW